MGFVLWLVGAGAMAGYVFGHYWSWQLACGVALPALALACLNDIAERRRARERYQSPN
jgi:hypothetical protein